MDLSSRRGYKDQGRAEDFRALTFLARKNLLSAPGKFIAAQLLLVRLRIYLGRRFEFVFIFCALKKVSAPILLGR